MTDTVETPRAAAADPARSDGRRLASAGEAAGDTFQRMDLAQHEQVVFCRDAASGLRAIIAIHNTTLGPAVGGTRMWPYASEEEALIDVLRLSEGMTD